MGVSAEAAADVLDAPLAQATSADKPFVIELRADWCEPCRRFDADVVARSDVQKALSTISFVRYDIDSQDGAAIAQRFGVAGVPTFLAIGPEGTVLDRSSGLPGDAIRAT